MHIYYATFILVNPTGSMEDMHVQYLSLKCFIISLKSKGTWILYIYFFVYSNIIGMYKKN